MKDNLTARGVTLLLSDHLLDKLDSHVEKLKVAYRRDPKVLQDVFDRQPSRVSVAARLLSAALESEQLLEQLYH
jgi:hypothetical protein